jgi:hypothetical protein
MRRLRPRTIALIQIAVGLVTFGAGVAIVGLPATAQTGGTTATFSKQGWWRAPSPLPSSVPATAIAVGAQGGNSNAEGALGLDFHLATDEGLESATLTLTEDATPGATYPPANTPAPPEGQPNPNAVAIGACPITTIWAPEQAGAFTNKPTADCEIARGDGVRKADGTWTFDITSLAELWDSGVIEQNGILFVERVAAPATFQISFQGLTGTKPPQLEIATTFIESTTTTTETTEPFVEDTSGGGSDTNFFTQINDSAIGTTDTPLGIVDTPTTSPPTAAAASPAATDGRIVNRRPTKGTLPLGLLLLVPLSLGLALMSGMVLGPAGDPATSRRREGGLSRALNQRARANTPTQPTLASDMEAL